MCRGMRVVAAALIVMIAAPSAFALGPEQPQPAAMPANDVLRTYVERIPAGSRVRVSLQDGSRLRGTLMLVEGNALVIRERKRRPEPPVRLPFTEIVDVELDQNGGSMARAVAIGAAVGASAALGVIAFLAAMLSD